MILHIPLSGTFREVEIDKERLGNLRTGHVYALQHIVLQALAAIEYATANRHLPEEVFGMPEDVARLKLESTARYLLQKHQDFEDELKRVKANSANHFMSVCLLHGFISLETMLKPVE